jgi:hypothetical protein
MTVGSNPLLLIAVLGTTYFYYLYSILGSGSVFKFHGFRILSTGDVTGTNKKLPVIRFHKQLCVEDTDNTGTECNIAATQTGLSLFQ